MRSRDVDGMAYLLVVVVVIALPIMAVVKLVEWYRSLAPVWQWGIPGSVVAIAIVAIWARVRARRRARERHLRWLEEETARQETARRREAERRRRWLEEEAAREEAARRRQRQLDRQLSYADGLSGTEFEHLVKRLLLDAGWSAQVAGGANDLGMDVTAVDGAGRRLVVQCKRFGAKAVGSKDMQAFLGTFRHVHGADVAAYVTASRFTKAAADLGGGAGVVLIDRPQLARWMQDGVPDDLEPWAAVTRPDTPGLAGPRPTRAPDAELPDHITVVVDRREIENDDFDDLSRTLTRLMAPDFARIYRGATSLRVHGYDDDPRELFAIPEVRTYLEALADTFPWAYYLPARDPMLKVLAFSLSGAETVALGRVHVSVDQLKVAVNLLSERALTHAERLGTGWEETTANLNRFIDDLSGVPVAAGD